MASPSEEAFLPPANFRTRLAPDVMFYEHGRLVTGGNPFRMIRLTPAGARLIAAWRTGSPLGTSIAERRLARQLVDAGVLYPDPAPIAALEELLTIVVPVRDGARLLDRCLSSLRNAAPNLEITVVDDGSLGHDRVASVAAAHGAMLIRHADPAGPAAARNTGLGRATKPLIGFVDCDIVVDRGTLNRLVAHFDDPKVSLAAPRILALEAQGRIAAYEFAHSSLDMGPAPASVGPHTGVPYVPSATLVARSEDIRSVGGFEESLRVGEDVDLAWRLRARGSRVIYDPAVHVRHDHRTEPIAFMRRRWDYAASIGPLASRHPDAFDPTELDVFTALALFFALRHRGYAASAMTVLRLALMAYMLKTRNGAPLALATRIAARSTFARFRGNSHAARRIWSPLILSSRRLRPLIVAAYAIRICEPDGPRNPMDLAIGVVEDLIAASATFASCARHGRSRPLQVRLTGYPLLDDERINTLRRIGREGREWIANMLPGEPA